MHFGLPTPTVRQPVKPQLQPTAAPLPGAGEDLLICVFFVLFNEGNGLRSKAVGHFICSQGDSKDVLMVPVVILWTETARGWIKGQVRGWRGTARVIHGGMYTQTRRRLS